MYANLEQIRWNACAYLSQKLYIFFCFIFIFFGTLNKKKGKFKELLCANVFIF